MAGLGLPPALAKASCTSAYFDHATRIPLRHVAPHMSEGMFFFVGVCAHLSAAC